MDEVKTDQNKENKKDEIVSQQEPEARIRSLDDWFASALDAETDFAKQSIEDERFYLGDQWDSNDKSKLEDKGRPALTYNQIFPIINLVNGYHRQNRQDLKVMNLRGGTQDVAEILTSLLKHTKGVKNGDWEISHAHLMGLICGKSYIGINIDYDEDLMNGELFYEFSHCRDVLIDPFGSRYDLTDRDFYFKSVWMPKARLERMFGDKIGDTLEVMPFDRQMAYGVETFNYEDAGKYQIQEPDDIEKFRYRVKECMWKEYSTQKFLISVSTGQVHNVSQLSKENIARLLQKMPDFRYVERVKPVLHMSQYIGKSELYHTEKPFGGMQNFPIVGFFPYFISGKCQGMVTQLKDAQREHNKRLSQALAHLNSSANSGFTADADAVDNWDDFVEEVAGVGFVKKIKPGKKFEKDHPTELSQGHVTLATIGASALKVISGVNSDLLGQDNTETVSGVAIARRQAQGLVSTEIVQDNLRLTLKILGDRSIEAIQKSGAYSREEIIRLVVDESDVEFEINKKLANIDRVLNDLSIGKYATVVTTSVQTPTARFSQYMTLLEAIKIGVPIPPDLLAEASDWPKKDKIIEGIKANMQAQAQAKQAELGEKEKDRQVKLLEIQERNKGELLRDAQKSQLDTIREHGNGKDVSKDRKSSSKN